MTDNLPPLPHPVRHDFVGDDTEDLYTADQMSAYAAQAVAAERERCAQIVSAYRVPVGNSAAGIATGYPYPEAGMTLRDYFAAKALPGVLYMVAHGAHDAASSAEGCALEAYKLADAMLAVRAA